MVFKPFMPNILRPSTAAETVKLNSLKKVKSSSSVRKEAASEKPARALDEQSATGLHNVVHEDHIDLVVAESESTPSYGALATTSTKLFQQEDGDNNQMNTVSDHEFAVTIDTDQQAPGDHTNPYSHVNPAYSSDLI